MASLQPYGVLIGRVALSLIFIMSGVNKLFNWSGTAEHMTNEGMPAANVILAGAVAFEILGGLSVLVGFKGRLGALALVIFLIPTTLIFHDFWTFEGEERQMQMINFMKNLSIGGGLLFLMCMGPGAMSVDNRTRASGGGGGAE